MRLRPVFQIAAVGCTVVLLLIGGTSPAAGDPSTAQKMIDAQLNAYPGGKQISPNQVAYLNGAFIITMTAPNTMATANCPSGWFCFYDGVNYTYPRGQLSSCGWQDLSWWGWHDRTESVHYNMATGSVRFDNHRAGWTTHSADEALFTISTSTRRDPDVSPARNKADHVFRTC